MLADLGDIDQMSLEADANLTNKSLRPVRRFFQMRDKYLLYIDILGFRALARQDRQRVYDLYRVVASLNVHDSHSFAVIVFSDTILVYNTSDPIDGPDHASTVMFLCEFAQDFLYRLTGYDVFFRLGRRGDVTSAHPNVECP